MWSLVGQQDKRKNLLTSSLLKWIDYAIITESWLRDGRDLEDDEQDLELGENIKLIHRNRKTKRGRTAGGGVLIAYDTNRMRLKEKTIRRGQAKIVCATGKKTGLSRQILVFSVYLPPKLSVSKAKETLDFLSEAVGRAKEEMEDPIIIIGGVQPRTRNWRLPRPTNSRLTTDKTRWTSRLFNYKHNGIDRMQVNRQKTTTTGRVTTMLCGWNRHSQTQTDLRPRSTGRGLEWRKVQRNLRTGSRMRPGVKFSPRHVRIAKLIPLFKR